MELPAHLELTPAWRAIRAELRRIVGEETFDIWLAPLTVQGWDGRSLLVDAPPQSRSWIAGRYRRVLERAVHAVLGEQASVAFTGQTSPGTEAGAAGAATDPRAVRSHELNHRYTFDQFIIGDSNRLAHAAALAVAERPGQAYNPLFLHAPPGLGKTHLLHAIGNYVRDAGDGGTVRYTTVESFTNHFLASLVNRSVDAFKHVYRDVDVLLIDDVQFLASKLKTEEEFFHTFNALYENGRQLVVTCDRLPHQLLEVEERLRERFSAGLVATIAPPDLAMRVAILHKRAALDRIVLGDADVLELIASRITTNVRALEGALIRIVAHASLTGEPLGPERASALLDDIQPKRQANTARMTIDRVQQTVAVQFGITVEELLSPARAGRISWPRQLAIHLSRELTGASLPELGRAFGGRNHATILHSCKRVAERVMNSSDAAHDLDNLRQRLSQDEADHHS